MTDHRKWYDGIFKARVVLESLRSSLPGPIGTAGVKREAAVAGEVDEALVEPDLLSDPATYDGTLLIIDKQLPRNAALEQVLPA